MLAERIRDGLARQVVATLATPGVHELARVAADRGGGFTTDEVLAITDGRTFRASPALAEEHFGAFALVVTYELMNDLMGIAEALEGTLTATIHCTPDEVEAVRPLARALQRKAGRLVWNGFPTGVTVTEAMGKMGARIRPARSRNTPRWGCSRSGRWLRPMCFQSYPDALLPPALQRANPSCLRTGWSTGSGTPPQPDPGALWRVGRSLLPPPCRSLSSPGHQTSRCPG